jgi:hypothetical protein
VCRHFFLKLVIRSSSERHRLRRPDARVPFKLQRCWDMRRGWGLLLRLRSHRHRVRRGAPHALLPSGRQRLPQKLFGARGVRGRRQRISVCLRRRLGGRGLCAAARYRAGQLSQQLQRPVCAHPLPAVSAGSWVALAARPSRSLHFPRALSPCSECKLSLTIFPTAAAVHAQQTTRACAISAGSAPPAMLDRRMEPHPLADSTARAAACAQMPQHRFAFAIPAGPVYSASVPRRPLRQSIGPPPQWHSMVRLSTAAAPATVVGAGHAWQGCVTASLRMSARTAVRCGLGSSSEREAYKKTHAQEAAGEHRRDNTGTRACASAARALTLLMMQQPRHMLPWSVYLRPRIRWIRLFGKDTHSHVPWKLLRPRRVRKWNLCM